MVSPNSSGNWRAYTIDLARGRGLVIISRFEEQRRGVIKHTNVNRRGFINTLGCGLGAVGLLAAVGEPVTADQAGPQ